MASSGMRSVCSLWMVFAFLLISRCGAREYMVGNSEAAWMVPLPYAEWLNQWASSHRFKIGDSLIWKYDHESESVMQVKGEHYAKCNKSNPIQAYNDVGDTKVELNRSGAFFFISGVEDHCEQGLKLQVKVLAGSHRGRHHSPATTPAPAPASAPAQVQVPAPAHFAVPPSQNGASTSGVGLMGIMMGVGVLLVMNIVFI